MEKQFKLWNVIAGWVVFAIAAVTYLLTIEPTASFWDCGEFISSADKLDVGHPPGAPFFMLMGHFFSLFASDASHVAMCVNALSALASAFTILFILVIATLVQMIEIILKKISPSLYQALGVFLPLITTNCCILGVAILVANGTNKLPEGLDHNLLTGTLFALATALGFAIALVLFAGLREQLRRNDVPKAMEGTPIALITAGILAMAFMGFSGVI